MKRFLISFLLYINICLPFAIAQNGSLRFRHITVEDGLSSNIVRCVTQDDNGFMWFGTYDGLNKYDGNKFTLYRRNSEDSLSISNNRIIELLVADDGKLWIGTTEGLSCYMQDDDSFISFNPPTFQFRYIHCLTQDSQGRIWVGTTDGLYQFNTVEKSYTINGDYSDNPYLFLDRNINGITEDNYGTLWISTTTGLFILNNGEITKASEMGKHPIFSSKEHFRDVQVDNEGNYWIATESLDNGITCFDSTLIFIKSYSNVDGQKEILAGNRVRKVRQLSDGKIWFGTFNGLSIYDPDQGTFHNYQENKYDPNSISNNSIQDIFEDRDGGIWLATFNGGINYFHPAFQKFEHSKVEFWKDNSLSSNLVSGFAQDDKGNMWVSTEDGLNYFDTSENSFTQFYREQHGKGLLDDAIKTISLDNTGNLWIGSLLGLSYFNLSNMSIQHFIHDPENEKSIGIGHIHSIYQDHAGVIWIGTNTSGLNRYNQGDNTFDSFGEIEYDPDEMLNTTVNTIVEYDNDFLWIGTDRGLELFDKQKELFTRSKIKNDGVFKLFSELDILSLYLDDEENLWIGTSGEGLHIYNIPGKKVYTIDDQAGLPNSTINSILEDELGNFWIGTNHGLSKLVKPANGWAEDSKPLIINFTTTDGLQGLQFYSRSAYKSPDGQLFFGGANGYNSFYPDKVNKTIIQSEVIFTDIRYHYDNAQGVKGGMSERDFQKDSIAINYGQSDFSLEFAALNYFDPGQTIYAYKMEPTDQDWKIIGKDRVVNFSKIPSGEYTFKVRATNNNLDWGEKFTQKSIAILPPIWLTWWAYTFYLIIILALLYLFFTVATSWGKLKSDLSWEHVEREKERDLHNQRIKFFTDISHELRTPLTLILAPLERLVNQYVGSTRLKNQLLMIQRNGERMLQLINQLLDLRKLETGHLHLNAGYGDIGKFICEVSLAFREMALNKNINYEVQACEDEVNIWFDRDKFEVILFNLLSNAIKYTPTGGSIGLSLKVHERSQETEPTHDDIFYEGYVEIIVEDNGRGIPSENLHKVFDRFYQSDQASYQKVYGSGVGLEIVKKFVDLHKGTISVNSIEAHANQAGKTRFIIKVPIGRKHLSDTDIDQNFKNSEDISLYEYAKVEEGFTPEQTSDGDFVTEDKQSTDTEQTALLVVEDNEDVRKFIVSLFESEYLVYEAPNGDQGLEYAFDKIPDLILSDIMMPGTDGLELCKRIKSDPRTSHVPVILLTARTAITFQIEGMETGADDYITKPFSANLLKTRVRKLIEQRKTLRKKFSKGPGLIPEEISITSVDEKLIKKAIDYINEHISDTDLKVEKIAGEVGMSRVHFYRKIKALTNLSPVEFIRRIRLERAAQLLKDGKLNVSEVRYAVGFQDADYFRKTFKHHFGHLPSDHTAGNNPANKSDI